MKVVVGEKQAVECSEGYENEKEEENSVSTRQLFVEEERNRDRWRWQRVVDASWSRFIV